MSVYERVKANYVEPVDDHTLIKGAIDGMLAALDPHSSYVEGADFDQLKTTTDGNYGGLGLTVSMEDGIVKVIAPTEDTPAWRAGIKAGDYITHINGEFLNGITLDQAVEKMKGEPGTPVKLTIVRPGRDKPFDVTVVRERIQLRPVKWEIKDGVGYINIDTFSGNVGEQVRSALAFDRQGDRRSSDRLCRRPSLEPGRPARPGGGRRRRLPRQRRDRLAARPHEGRYRALLCAAGRHGPRASGDRADRRRHRLGVGDRRRRAPGSPPRADHGRDELRQGLGPDRRPDRSRRGAAADHGALLHAVGPLGSGRRDRARHRRPAAHRSRLQGPPGSSARRTFAGTCSRRRRSRTSCSRATTRPIRASRAKADDLKKQGIKDFQLYYALNTLKRLAAPAPAASLRAAARPRSRARPK